MPNISSPATVSHAQNDLDVPKEKSGSLADETGLDRITQIFMAGHHRKRAVAATALGLAIAECDPQDACGNLVAALAHGAFAIPIAPLFDGMEQAKHWAGLAIRNEPKACIWPC